MRRRVLVIFGTRPEAIKLAPVVRTLSQDAELDTRVCVTAQHRHLLDQVLSVFQICPDVDLEVMTPGQELPALTAAIITRVAATLRAERPDLVLVHGDTTTTFAASLAAFYERIPVGHVEAGLRTGDLTAPWPEEANRKLTGVLTTLHFVPTRRARLNLQREDVPAKAIHVTGNTVIDALLATVQRLRTDAETASAADRALPALSPNRRLVVVTAHRRESFGEGMRNISVALRTLAGRGDLDIVYPVHLNPNVQRVMQEHLGNTEGVHLVPPLDYLPFVQLMTRASLILTDSGGIQEEAPALHVPVLVMRDTTERPEAVDAGCVRLVGTDVARLVQEASRVLDDPETRARMTTARNPFGDGQAAHRIHARVRQHLGLSADLSLGQWDG